MPCESVSALVGIYGRTLSGAVASQFNLICSKDTAQSFRSASNEAARAVIRFGVSRTGIAWSARACVLVTTPVCCVLAFLHFAPALPPKLTWTWMEPLFGQPSAPGGWCPCLGYSRRQRGKTSRSTKRLRPTKNAEMNIFPLAQPRFGTLGASARRNARHLNTRLRRLACPNY